MMWTLLTSQWVRHSLYKCRFPDDAVHNTASSFLWYHCYWVRNKAVVTWSRFHLESLLEETEENQPQNNQDISFFLLTFCWPCISVYSSQYLTNLMHKICFTISFISCLYMFRAHVFIIRWSKLRYTASGIITHIGGRLVHQTATYRCDDTRGCITQFWPPDDEHMCSKHVEAWNKLTVKQKFCASSWLIDEINRISVSWPGFKLGAFWTHSELCHPHCVIINHYVGMKSTTQLMFS